MLTTTTKLVACLAAVSTMECKGSAQATDHNEGNNLPVPPTTVPEMPTVESTDTALLDNIEDRVFNFPHGIPPFRMKYPSRVPRILVSPHIDQAKLEDLQRASLLEKVHPLITVAAENSPAFYHPTYPNKDAMIKAIRNLVWSDTPKSEIWKKIARSTMLSHDTKKTIEKAIEEAIDEYRIELKQSTTKWWNEDTNPKEVFVLLGEPKQQTVKHRVYLDYKRAYYDHQARLGFEYITWFLKTAHPTVVLKKLNKMFPGQEKMMTKYHSEYKKLFEEYPDIMEKMHNYLKPPKAASAYSEQEQLRKSLNTLSTNTQQLFKLLRSTRKKERKIQAWKKERKIPDEVYASSTIERKNDSTLEDSQQYLSFLMYRDWWIYNFPDKAVKLWMRQQKELQEVLVLLRLDSVPEHELPLHPMYPYFKKYRDWWIDTFPDKAVKWCMQQQKELHEVVALLKLDSVPEHELPLHPMYPYFMKYRDWWIDTFPDKAVKLCMQQQKELHEVLVLLKLDSVPEHELPLHPMYPHFLVYRNWWINTHPKQALKVLMQEGYYPEEVFVLLKLDSVPNHELPLHPMYSHYLDYCKEWIVTYPDKALESWKHKNLKSDDVIAALESLEESDRLKMRPYYEDFMDWLAVEQIGKRLMQDSP